MTSHEFFDREAEIFKGVPMIFRGSLAGLAHDSGHAYGQEEILTHLADLVEGLKPIIEAYKETLDIAVSLSNTVDSEGVYNNTRGDLIRLGADPTSFIY